MFNQGMTVGGYLDTWLDTVIKGSVRYSTYTSYNGYINNHIKRFMGGDILAETKTANVQGLVAKLVEEGRIGARTIGIIIGMLKNALGYAEEYELIMKNPCRKIRLPKVEEDEVEIFDDNEQTRIEKAVFKSGDNRYYGALLTLYTGVRIGELCALKWCNVDFANKCLYIKKSLNRTARNDDSGKKTIMAECEPKTKKSKRIIQLPDFILKLLRKLKSESSSDYVLSMKSGKYVHPRTMQTLHKKLLLKAGVSYNNFHVLRHTFATRASENTDAKTVSDTLGHTNTMITVNRYMHSQREQKQRMMNGLNTYFNRKKIAAYL
ncbi:MAG: site-specific integrase [Firmicutes bacterium]|nr:site-specific integrase [Bacillota bacterium]